MPAGPRRPASAAGRKVDRVNARNNDGRLRSAIPAHVRRSIAIRTRSYLLPPCASGLHRHPTELSAMSQTQIEPIPSEVIDTGEDDRLAYHNLRQTSIRSGLTAYRINALAAAGRIRTRALPGIPTRYCLDDAIACAAEAQ